MKLVLNLQNLLPHFSIEEAAKLIADTDFDGADYYLNDMIDPACSYNTGDWVSQAECFKSTFEAAGVPIVQTHAPFRFKGWDDPATYEEFIYPAIVRSVKISAVMGAKCVVVHPLHYWRYDGNEQEIFERNMDFYKSLIPVCKEYNIKVGIENMFQRDKLRGNYIVRDVCSDATEFCRYIDSLNSEYMVACLDVGHVGLPHGHMEAWDYIRILGHDRLQALHIHDNDYLNDQHRVPYSGKIDWNNVTKALGEIDYTGDFTYECLFKHMANELPNELYPAVLKFVSQVGRYLIDQIEVNRKPVVKA